MVLIFILACFRLKMRVAECIIWDAVCGWPSWYMYKPIKKGGDLTKSNFVVVFLRPRCIPYCFWNSPPASLFLPVGLFWLLPVCLFPIGLSLRANGVTNMHALSIHQNRNIDGWGISGGGCTLFIILYMIWRMGGSESGHVTRWTNHTAEIWISGLVLEKSHYY